MAETCAIDSSYPTSYSTSIVLLGLRALLLPILRREHWQTTGQWWFFTSLIARVTKVFQLKCVIFLSVEPDVDSVQTLKISRESVGYTSIKIAAKIIKKTIYTTQKIADFSKTGSRNMAETCAINFSYPTYYSFSIVLEDLWGTLLPVLT